MGALAIWMNGEMVGTWRVGRTGHHQLDYAPSWRASARSRPLSLSLPFTADNRLEGDVVRNYFDNLLPDSDGIRKRISERFRTKGTDVFTLLQAVGRDCAGAVQLLLPGVTPQGFDQLRYESLTTEQVENHLAALGSQIGVGAQDDEEDLRLSIAGAQEKTALLQVNGQWCRPLGATPTTHILKPPIGITTGRNLDLRLSVENEWLCNQIVRELGLPAAECQMQNFGARRALVVQRFDRSWHPAGWIARLPQEDFCQAKGVASNQKYEQQGGPSIEACLEVLKGGAAFHEDGRNFLCAQLLFWFLAAIDGHAKNFSLFVLPGGRYRMTPLYDVLSAWPLIGTGPHALQYKKTKLAMAVRGKSAHYKLCEIQRRHWQALAKRSAVDGAWDAMLDMTQRLDAALTAVEQRLPADFPAELARAVFQGVRQHLEQFNRRGLPADDAAGE
ncbi:type II toxin-antitoxin system HipA family toxin [Rhodoferax sp.]|uniref:type II toxin-antitoxin system HipA family toxin n=1 Tax=Rhodoferax sp. TaxID=50421 RepID=UPI00263580BF|nr:type II toxin-antitoxin system HipA family toxin [Rhodoferax sp.]MDD5478268.1 type II toxin-antitoxin system HipA family toxin [Rhodoferax sp.]